MLIPKQNRAYDEKHRRWIASLPCCLTGVVGQTQAAHVSKGRYSMGMKADDSCCVPLAYPLHAFQHQHGEDRFWRGYRKTTDQAKQLAKDLHSVTGETEKALLIIAGWR